MVSSDVKIPSKIKISQKSENKTGPIKHLQVKRQESIDGSGQKTQFQISPGQCKKDQPVR